MGHYFCNGNTSKLTLNWLYMTDEDEQRSGRQAQTCVISKMSFLAAKCNAVTDKAEYWMVFHLLLK